MKSIKLTFEADSVFEVNKMLIEYLEREMPSAMEYVRQRAISDEPAPQLFDHVVAEIQESEKAVEQAVEKMLGSCPKTYAELRDAVKAIIGADKDKLSRHNEILAGFEAKKISDIQPEDYAAYWTEVQKL